MNTHDESDSRKSADASDNRALSAILDATPPRPFLRDEDADDDRFGAADVASRLVPVIHQVPPPFTISVSGAWGVGKTTLMRRVRDVLATDKEEATRIPVIEVDLWTEDLADLRRRLALEVAVGLSAVAESDRRAAVKSQAKEFDAELRGTVAEQAPPAFHAPSLREHWPRLVIALAVIAAAVYAISGVTVPTGLGDPDPLGLRLILTGAISLGVWLLVTSGLVFSVTNVTTTTPPLEEKVAFLQKFQEMVSSNGHRRVLIVIDNIDRLAGDDAVAVLADIRAFVEVEKSRCIFVVPIDRDALVRHLSRTMGGDDQTARDYLDKFFNLDVLLTKPVREDLRAWTRDDLVAPLFPRATSDVVSLVSELIAEAAEGSPRAAKRIANGIYARAYLLPMHERSISLLALVFVESLVARFPRVLNPMLADPRRWLEVVGLLRGAPDEEERTRHVRALSGLPTVAGSAEDASVETMLASLRRLLLFPATIPSEADLRTILALRSDRQWAGVPKAGDVQLALNEGDAPGLRSILDATLPEERSAILRVCLDAIRSDQQQGWRQRVVRQLNVLAIVLDPNEPAALELVRIADEFLLMADGAYYRQLNPAAVDLLFKQPARLPHRARVIGRVHEELERDERTDATALVDAIAVLSADPTAIRLSVIAQALSARTDAELTPVFDRPASSNVLKSLYTKYGEILRGWDGSQELAAIETAASRFRAIDAVTEGIAQEDVDRISTQMTAIVPELEAEAVAVLEQFAPTLQRAAASAALDGLAGALVQWTSAGVRSFELALSIPTSPGQLTALGKVRLTSADADEFARLRQSREKLRSVAISYSNAAMLRWANGQGHAYAVWAIEGSQADDLEEFRAGLALVTDNGVYTSNVNALAQALRNGGHADAAQILLDDISRRIPTLAWTIQTELIPAVRAAAAIADPSEVLDAIATDLEASDADTVDDATQTALAFADSRMPGTDRLPPIIARHGATIGVASPHLAANLISRAGVDHDDVRTGYIGAIQRLPANRVLGTAPGMRKKVHRSVAVGIALVDRASQETAGDRLPWLEEATHWKAPKARDARQQYAAALDAALEGDDTVDDVVRELRTKLATP